MKAGFREEKTDMENLIDIMQLSVEEIDALVQKGCDIMANLPHTPISATEKFWQRCFLNPPPAPA